MAKARNLVDWFLFFLGVMAIFFVILGIAAFVAWINLVVSGEYTDMMKQIGFVTGRVVSTISLTVFVGMMVFRYFKRRKRVVATQQAQPQPEPSRKLPGGVMEMDFIRQLEKNDTYKQFSFLQLEQMKEDHPGREVLRGKILNWQKFWIRREKKRQQGKDLPIRPRDRTRNEIEEMEKSNSRSYPIELKIA